MVEAEPERAHSEPARFQRRSFGLQPLAVMLLRNCIEQVPNLYKALTKVLRSNGGEKSSGLSSSATRTRTVQGIGGSAT